MADRYAVPFQAFITNGAVITSDVTGRVATAGNTTLTLSTTGGAGTFTITLGSGCTGTVTSGTATITGSVLALAAGANTVTSNGAGTCTLNLTLGTAANWNTVNTWSAATGGVSGASVPTSADNTIFNANSFTAASQVLTVNAATNCLDMTWTGATNTPTLAGGTFFCNIYGSLTFIADMVITATMTLGFQSTVEGKTITLAQTTTTIASAYFNGAGGGWTLLDAFNIGSKAFSHRYGTINTNGQTVTCGIFGHDSDVTKAVILGASVVNCTQWYYAAQGVNLTVTAGTSSIRVTGTGSFNGNGKTYNEVQLNGTAHTVSGDNTFSSSLIIAATATVTLGSTTQTCGAFTNSGTIAANTATIIITGTGAFAGNSQTTYYIVKLNGTAHTISGSNTIGTLHIGRTAAVAITGTAGTTQTIRHLVVPNNTNVLTINSTGAAWTITGNTGYFESDYLSLTNVVAAWPNIYYAGDHSTDGTGNTNWIFRRKVRVWR